MTELSVKEKFPAAFPKLSPIQIAQVAEVAECRTYHDGDILLRTGETEFKFHVIQKGEIEIIDSTGDEPKLLVTHGPFEFTGDIDRDKATRACALSIDKYCSVAETLRLSGTKLTWRIKVNGN